VIAGVLARGGKTTVRMGLKLVGKFVEDVEVVEVVEVVSIDDDDDDDDVFDRLITLREIGGVFEVDNTAGSSMARDSSSFVVDEDVGGDASRYTT
jgi:hypothetical protein